MVGLAIASVITCDRGGAAAGPRPVARPARLHAHVEGHPPAAAPVRGDPAGRLLGSLTTLTANVTAMVMTGLVGRFGVAALAGYSIGVRLEFMVAPIAFGIGTGLTTLVGVAAGAGAWQRAVRVAWTGGLIAFGMIGADRLDGRAAARSLVAPVHHGSRGDRRQRLLHHPRGAVLLPVRTGPDAEFREPGCGPHDRAGRGGHRAHGGRDGRRLVRRREVGLGPRRRVHGDRGQHGGLWLCDRGTLSRGALAIEAA